MGSKHCAHSPRLFAAIDRQNLPRDPTCIVRCQEHRGRSKLQTRKQYDIRVRLLRLDRISLGLESAYYTAPSSVHCVKSISFPHLLHLCVLSNSSEKISLASPHSGHLHWNDFRFLKFSNPGQCCGVVMISSLHLINYVYIVQCIFSLIIDYQDACQTAYWWNSFNELDELIPISNTDETKLILVLCSCILVTWEVFLSDRNPHYIY